MAGKRTRKSAAAEAAAAAAAPSKSPMQESADALAGVEGALTGGNGKRKAAAAGASPKKKSPKVAVKTEAAARSRSNSIDRLADVAGSILLPAGKAASTSATAVATAAAAVAASSVPNPMAVAVDASKVPPPATAAAVAPTGFRKKGGAAAKSAAAATAKVAAAAAARAGKPIAIDGKTKSSSNKKTQITYNPDIPMTKEQLTAWRREMRRVRNRESAAASRRKVRDRIEELEEEVEVWKRRYQEVMARLGQAEQGAQNEQKAIGEGDGKGGDVMDI